MNITISELRNKVSEGSELAKLLRKEKLAMVAEMGMLKNTVYDLTTSLKEKSGLVDHLRKEKGELEVSNEQLNKEKSEMTSLLETEKGATEAEMGRLKNTILYLTTVLQENAELVNQIQEDKGELEVSNERLNMEKSELLNLLETERSSLGAERGSLKNTILDLTTSLLENTELVNQLREEKGKIEASYELLNKELADCKYASEAAVDQTEQRTFTQIISSPTFETDMQLTERQARVDLLEANILNLENTNCLLKGEVEYLKGELVKNANGGHMKNASTPPGHMPKETMRCSPNSMILRIKERPRIKKALEDDFKAEPLRGSKAIAAATGRPVVRADVEFPAMKLLGKTYKEKIASLNNKQEMSRAPVCVFEHRATKVHIQNVTNILSNKKIDNECVDAVACLLERMLEQENVPKAATVFSSHLWQYIVHGTSTPHYEKLLADEVNKLKEAIKHDVLVFPLSTPGRGGVGSGKFDNWTIMMFEGATWSWVLYNPNIRMHEARDWHLEQARIVAKFLEPRIAALIQGDPHHGESENV